MQFPILLFLIFAIVSSLAEQCQDTCQEKFLQCHNTTKATCQCVADIATVCYRGYCDAYVSTINFYCEKYDCAAKYCFRPIAQEQYQNWMLAIVAGVVGCTAIIIIIISVKIYIYLVRRERHRQRRDEFAELHQFILPLINPR